MAIRRQSCERPRLFGLFRNELSSRQHSDRRGVAFIGINYLPKEYSKMDFRFRFEGRKLYVIPIINTTIYRSLRR